MHRTPCSKFFAILPWIAITSNPGFGKNIEVSALASSGPIMRQSFAGNSIRTRRAFVVGTAGAASASVVNGWIVGTDAQTSTLAHAASSIPRDKSLCSDLDSCREIGEKKIEEDLKNNPIVRFDNGVEYKQLKAGFGSKAVQSGSKIDLIYSITSASGAYMYSQGFGFEKVDLGNNNIQRDLGLDSYVVELGTSMLPVGVEQVLVGMKKGERRRLVLPPSAGFETSDWKPEPTTRLGKTSIATYKTLLRGNGPTRPAFPAPTIWDVEVLRIIRE
jgi:hypothetical protein